MPRRPITYEDFVIPISADSAGNVMLRVSASPVGETETITLTPGSHLGRLLTDGDARLGASNELPDEAAAERLGQQLYDALFCGPIHRRFLEAIGRLGAEGTAGLRIKLQMDFANPTASALQSLPWELLYRAETGTFLALHTRLAVVRHLSLPTPRERMPSSGRTKLLVASANPSDRLPLASAEECRKISASWRHSDGLEIHYLAGATLERLRNQLTAETYQGFHFIGHGELDTSTGEGRLVLEDSAGRAAPCRAKDLAVQLADRTELSWVVLNACSSGQTSLRQPFGSMAAALLQTGIPALVAMQKPVSDEAAIRFSQSFYGRLAAGDGVESATSEGRLAVRRAFPQTAEWATPMLFLRSADGQVLALDHAAAESKSPGARWLAPLFAGLCLVLLSVLIGQSKSETNPALPTASTSPAASTSSAATTPHSAESTVDRSPPAPAPRQHIEVREGEVVEIPALGIHVSVTFDASFGTPFARLAVTHTASGQGKIHPFMGPDQITLANGSQLAIQQIQWDRRSITLIPPN